MNVPPKDGFTGRECPKCHSYFAVDLWSGAARGELRSFCPYCGHRDRPICFWTREQIRRCLSAITQDSSDESIPPIAGPELSSRLECDGCALRFTIYGVLRFCPRCGPRNSLRFLKANTAIIRKEVWLAQTLDPVEAAPIIERASQQLNLIRFDFWKDRRPGGIDPRKCPALHKRKKEDESEQPASVYQERHMKLERARQKAGLASVLDFPTPELAREWELVNEEYSLLRQLTLLEDAAQDWVKAHRLGYA